MKYCYTYVSNFPVHPNCLQIWLYSRIFRVTLNSFYFKSVSESICPPFYEWPRLHQTYIVLKLIETFQDLFKDKYRLSWNCLLEITIGKKRMILQTANRFLLCLSWYWNDTSEVLEARVIQKNVVQMYFSVFFDQFWIYLKRAHHYSTLLLK